MANVKVEQVLVTPSWRGNTVSGSRANQVAGREFSGPASTQTPPGTTQDNNILNIPAGVQNPAAVNHDLQPLQGNNPAAFLWGALTCINPYTRTAYNTGAAAVNPGTDVWMPGVPSPPNQGMQFALYNQVRGAILSDIIKRNCVEWVHQTPFFPMNQHVTVFSIAYNSPNNIVTPRGSNVSVKVNFDRDYWEIRDDKYSAFSSTIVGPQQAIVNPAVGATAAEIQRAHFDLMEGLINWQRDLGPSVGNLFIDAQLTRLFTYNANYSCVVLVGGYKRQFATDMYWGYQPVKHDVALFEGFNNIFHERPLSTTAGFTSAVVNNRSYIGMYIGGDKGNGEPNWVAWHEAEQIGQTSMGMRNHYFFPQPRVLNSDLHDPTVMYDTVNIEYWNRVVLSPDYHDKNMYKRLTLYIDRQAGVARRVARPLWWTPGPAGANPPGNPTFLPDGSFAYGQPPPPGVYLPQANHQFQNIVDVPIAPGGSTVYPGGTDYNYAANLIPFGPAAGPPAGPAANDPCGVFNFQYQPQMVAVPGQGDNAKEFANDNLAPKQNAAATSTGQNQVTPLPQPQSFIGNAFNTMY